MPIRVSIVDDNENVLDSIKLILKSLKDFVCAGCYRSAREAVAGISVSRPDVVLMDIRMPEMSGIECTQRLKSVLPSLGVIMFTGFPNKQALLESLMAGATGYLEKPFSAANLESALHAVSQKRAALSPAAIQDLVETLNHSRRQKKKIELTARERQIMACLLLRKSDKDISEDLRIAPGTVHAHLDHLFAKLQVHSRDEAVQKYLGLPSGAGSQFK